VEPLPGNDYAQRRGTTKENGLGKTKGTRIAPRSLGKEKAM
jgi:hypothetical protein